MLPAVPARGLVIALHGFGLTGPKMVDLLGMGEHVTRTGLAIIAPSGGNHYWHRRRAGMDPGAVVLDDIRPLGLREAGLAADARVAFLGLSMGGYGALLLASELGRAGTFGVVAESAALWTEADLSAEGAFDDREDFLAHDIFARSKALFDIPIRLDCGTDDPFIAANRAFAERVPHAEAAFDAGGHTRDYWRAHCGAQLDWLAALLGGVEPARRIGPTESARCVSQSGEPVVAGLGECRLHGLRVQHAIGADMHSRGAPGAQVHPDVSHARHGHQFLGHRGRAMPAGHPGYVIAGDLAPGAAAGSRVRGARGFTHLPNVCRPDFPSHRGRRPSPASRKPVRTPGGAGARRAMNAGWAHRIPGSGVPQ